MLLVYFLTKHFITIVNYFPSSSNFLTSHLNGFMRLTYTLFVVSQHKGTHTSLLCGPFKEGLQDEAF